MKLFRSKKLTDSAKDMPCIRCGKEGETRACHFNGFRQMAYGKGRSQKCSDFMTAEFCDACDRIFSEGMYFQWRVDDTNRDQRASDFLHWIALTNIRRLERGILKID